MDVVSDAELAKKWRLSCEVANPWARPAVHGQLSNVPHAVDRDIAFIGLDQANDHVETGVLAGSVWPNRPDEISPLLI